jgi:hypothetical protein
MMKSLMWAAAPLVALLAASAALAQNHAGHCSQCQSTYGGGYGATLHDSCHDNFIWPRQYVWPSRRGICATYDVMIANGWRRNNLLGKYDFLPNGEGLSEAGRLRVEWILTQAPPERRTIFVQRGNDPAETAVRVEAVQALAANMNPSMGPVDVQETLQRDYGRPADTVDAVFTGFTANQPAPVLPAASAPGETN